MSDDIKPGSVLARFGHDPDGTPSSTEAKKPDFVPGSLLRSLGHDVVIKGKLPPEFSSVESPLTPTERQLASERGLPAQTISGIPIVGPLFELGSAAARATSPRPTEAERGDSFAKRMDQRVTEIRRADEGYARENPLSSIAANTAGALAALPLGATSVGARLLGTKGATLGGRVYSAMAGGAGINAMDAMLRGQDPRMPAVVGGAGGFAGPIIGEGARGFTNALVNRVVPRAGPLNGVNRVGVDMLTSAIEGETPASMSAAIRKVGPAGFVGDLNTGLTDLTGGIADTPGSGKALVREAYRLRAEDQARRIDGAITTAMGPKTDILQYQQGITAARKAASDPLYEQWRTMQVHPTNEIKGLMPRLEAAGAFDEGEKLSAIRGEPMNKKFFTGGPQKEYPTTQSWDYVKQGLDSKIEQAYAGGNKKLAASLIGLKNDLVSEIEKTPAGQVWKQARSAFADHSALIDQIAAGRDTFLGGRSGLTVAEVKDELRSLSKPELAARIQGMRSAVADAMGDSTRGDTTLRNKLLASNNQEKLRLMLGPKKADELVRSLEQEKLLGDQAQNVTGGSQTTPKKERVNALQPQPLPAWNPSIAEPLSLIPPHVREMLRPTTVIEGTRAQRYDAARAALAPILTLPTGDPGTAAVLNALSGESARRAAIGSTARRVGNALTASSAAGSYDYGRYLEANRR